MVAFPSERVVAFDRNGWSPWAGIRMRERFAGYSEATLVAPAHHAFLAARLMEEGDGEELRWLLATVGREALVDLLATRGGRLLSRRSRAFWERVLAAESAPPHPLARELWPPS